MVDPLPNKLRSRYDLIELQEAIAQVGQSLLPSTHLPADSIGWAIVVHAQALVDQQGISDRSFLWKVRMKETME